MFGGLEVKSKTQEREKSSDSQEPSSTNAAPPAASSSAFSFLNAAPAAEAPAAEEPATSAFSFLAPTKSQNSQEAPPPAAASRAFGFLNSPPSKDESDAAETPAPAPATAANSAFNFMQSTVSSVPPLPEETPAAQPPPTASGFSFLTPPNGGGGNDTVSTMSRDSPETTTNISVTSNPAPAPAAPTDFLASCNPNQPVGSGVVFGGAMATKSKPKKKRTRTAKVGAAAHAAETPAMPPRPPMNMASPMQQSSLPEENTRNEAEEAARRAEEFLNEKMKQHATEQQQQQQQIDSLEPPPSSTSSFTPPTYIQESPSEEDDIVAAAKAAAEEAEKMNSSKPSLGARMGFGGLFRSRTSPPATMTNVISHGSSHSHGRPPVPTTTNTPTVETHKTELTPAERLQKEQEDVRRVIAERQSNSTNAASLAHDREHDNEESTGYPGYAQPIASIPVPAPPVKSSWTPPAIAPVKEVAVPKPKTPTDIFEDMMKHFHEQVVRSMEEVTRLRQHRSGLLEERFVTLAKERLATNQKAQAEAQQMAAAEAEDFELADRMGSIIESHEREQAEFSSILENITRALKQLDSQKQKVVDQVTKCFHDIQTKLKAFQDEQESQETEDQAEALKRFTATSKQLSAENERLQQDLKHLERDAQLVAEERKELESAISEQAGEYEKMRDDAQQKLKEVEEEIEDLRKQLTAKQAVAAELRTEAAGHDEAVLKVRVKFSRQLTRVQKKESTVQDNREEWELEKKSYESQKESHDAEVKTHSEALLARDQLLDALSKEIEMADTFESIVAKEIGFEATSEDGDDMDGELAHMQAEVAKAEAAASEAKELLKVAASTLTNLEEEHKSLEHRIPQLEEIKKSSAQRRDFRAAKNAATEIKHAQARLKECKEELEGEAKGRKAAAEAELAVLERDLKEKRVVANEKEKEAGLVAMQRLADNIKRLVATKQSVCAESSEKSIQGVGAFVLDRQIKALKMEGQTYGDKFGGWDELIAEIGIDHNGEPDEAAPGDSTDKEHNPNDPEKEQASQQSDVPGTNEAQASGESSLHGGARDEESKADKMKRFRDLTRRLQEAEDAINAAVAEEDFDRAAGLDDTLQDLMTEVQSISLTDEEMDAALAGDFPETGEEAASEDPTAEKVPEPEKMEREPTASIEDVAQERPPEDEAEVTPEDSEQAQASSGEGTEAADEVETPDNTRDAEDEKAKVKNVELPGDNGEIVNVDETPDDCEKLASNGDIKAETSSENVDDES